MAEDMGYTTLSGTPMKSGNKQIVTGMDRLVNPVTPNSIDQVFDSEGGRDINTGEVQNTGGIVYKGLKK